ncbi:TPA: hypothetical protein ACX485_001394 [Neisseria meningitidis]
MANKKLIAACLFCFLLNACTAPKPPTVNGENRIPVNQKAEMIF